MSSNERMETELLDSSINNNGDSVSVGDYVYCSDPESSCGVCRVSKIELVRFIIPGDDDENEYITFYDECGDVIWQHDIFPVSLDVFIEKTKELKEYHIEELKKINSLLLEVEGNNEK